MKVKPYFKEYFKNEAKERIIHNLRTTWLFKHNCILKGVYG